MLRAEHRAGGWRISPYKYKATYLTSVPVGATPASIITRFAATLEPQFQHQHLHWYIHDIPAPPFPVILNVLSFLVKCSVAFSAISLSGMHGLGHGGLCFSMLLKFLDVALAGLGKCVSLLPYIRFARFFTSSVINLPLIQ